jgi:hypothetical protein
VRPRRNDVNRKEFEEFCGAWSKVELSEFEKASAATRKIDPGDWK